MQFTELQVSLQRVITGYCGGNLLSIPDMASGFLGNPTGPITTTNNGTSTTLSQQYPQGQLSFSITSSCPTSGTFEYQLASDKTLLFNGSVIGNNVVISSTSPQLPIFVLSNSIISSLQDFVTGNYFKNYLETNNANDYFSSPQGLALLASSRGQVIFSAHDYLFLSSYAGNGFLSTSQGMNYLTEHPDFLLSLAGQNYTLSTYGWDYLVNKGGLDSIWVKLPSFLNTTAAQQFLLTTDGVTWLGTPTGQQFLLSSYGQQLIQSPTMINGANGYVSDILPMKDVLFTPAFQTLFLSSSTQNLMPTAVGRIWFQRVGYSLVDNGTGAQILVNLLANIPVNSTQCPILNIPNDPLFGVYGTPQISIAGGLTTYTYNFQGATYVLSLTISNSNCLTSITGTLSRNNVPLYKIDVGSNCTSCSYHYNVTPVVMQKRSHIRPLFRR